jgi:hypothetical protein
VSGKLDAFYSSVPVKKTVTWQVKVPYQTTRYVEKPYTTYQYYSYPCGRSICSGSTPVTSYRSTPQTVTEYRTEDRSQQYDATESRAELSAQVNLFVDLRPLAQPLGTVVTEQKVETGLTHSGVAAASLAPATAHVATASVWDERMRKEAQKRLTDALVEHWRDAFCAPPLEGAEAAARCAWGGRAKPEELKDLSALFRDDLAGVTKERRFGGP